MWLHITKLGALLFLILYCTRHVHCGTDEEDIVAIDTFIRDVMESEELVGLTIAVVKQGRPLMATGYGVKDTYTGGDVTNETTFYLASCSKAFNSALLSLALAENPGYTFDSRVRDIYPEFALETGFRSEHATLRDLVAHRTGVAEAFLPVLAGVYTSREDYLSRARFFPALYPFRAGESYHNLMVTTSGEAASILLQAASWEEAMRSRILSPLGMDLTNFVQDLTPEELDVMATPHELDNGSPRLIDKVVFGANLGPAAPSGGLITNSVDMQKWLLFLTSKGLAGDGSRVMNESDIMRTMREQSLPYYINAAEDVEQPVEYALLGIALGWYNAIFRGYNQVSHGGYFFGFQSKVSVLPDKGHAIYTNINCPQASNNDSVQDRIHNFVLDTLLGVTPPGEVQFASHPREPLLYHDNTIDLDLLYDSDIEISARDLQDYVGTYGNFAQGNLTIYYNSSADEIWGTWGMLGLVRLVPRTQLNDSFIGIVQEPLWFAPPLTMIFESTDGTIVDRLTIPFFMPQAPPVFIRDLQMDDAPPPPSDSCEGAAVEARSTREYE